MVQVNVKQLAHARGLPLPGYMTEGAAGVDLLAAGEAEVTIPTGGYLMVPTGLEIALPEGYEGQIRPRSGLAAKFGVTVLNAPGTVDADYRGEIKVILVNHGQKPYRIQRGDRIAQLVVAPVSKIQWVPSETLDLTTRGSGGFGHTGTR
ncbi:MAG: dUTP diphosphatase [Firmicutes bacterium]|nr:dUTP diphosphatase [Bacillota bacterium]